MRKLARAQFSCNRGDKVCENLSEKSKIPMTFRPSLLSKRRKPSHMLRESIFYILNNLKEIGMPTF